MGRPNTPLGETVPGRAARANSGWRRCADPTAHDPNMKTRFITSLTALGALALTLVGCASSGSEARDLTTRWLEGDSSVQCLAAPSTWTTWSLGKVQLLGEVDGAQRWAVEIAGTRSMRPESGGHLLVDIDEGGGCVRWYEFPQPW